MAKGLFASPKKALLFVGMTLFGVVMLVGTEEDEGALVQATSGMDEPEPEFAPRRDLERVDERRRETRKEAGSMAGFAAPEDLIDTTEGFDPTPRETGPVQPRTDFDAGDSQAVPVEVGDGTGNL